MFKNNSLVLQFAKFKGYQNGKYHAGPWHVYLKPRETHLCSVLELARYLFTNLEVLTNKTLLLQVEYHYRWYYRMFLLLIKDILEYLKNFGVEEGDLGAYSYIIGVANVFDAGYNFSHPFYQYV